ncbi:MAG: hypothetical protein ACYDH6_05880 [Acidimicrobiales bacterium]
MSFNARVAAAGAAVDLAVLVPLVALYAAVGGATLVAPIAGAVLAPLAGGAVAGRRPTDAPLTHGAAAAALASFGYVAFRVIDAVTRDRPVHPASVALLVMIGVTVGSFGGWLGFRSRPPVASP